MLIYYKQLKWIGVTDLHIIYLAVFEMFYYLFIFLYKQNIDETLKLSSKLTIKVNGILIK